MSKKKFDISDVVNGANLNGEETIHDGQHEVDITVDPRNNSIQVKPKNGTVSFSADEAIAALRKVAGDKNYLNTILSQATQNNYALQQSHPHQFSNLTNLLQSTETYFQNARDLQEQTPYDRNFERLLNEVVTYINLVTQHKLDPIADPDYAGTAMEFYVGHRDLLELPFQDAVENTIDGILSPESVEQQQKYQDLLTNVARIVHEYAQRASGNYTEADV